MRSSAPAPPRVLRVTGGGRHRFTSGRIADVLTPIPAGWPAGQPAGDAAARPGGRTAGRDGSAWAGRALRTLAGALLVTWSFRLSGYLTSGPWLALPVAVLGLAGLLAIIVAWLPEGPRSARWQRRADWAVLAAALAGLALWSYFQVYAAPDYGTDEIAFDQYAAQLAVHGLNPYLHSMAPAFPLFHVSPNGYTFLLSGHPVTSLSYPALAFEAYLPLLALGVATQAAVGLNVAAWALGCIVLFAVLPRRLAPLAAIVAGLDVFTGYAVGGVTDFLFVPLLVGAAVCWDRFPAARGPAAWRGPVLLGLAMAVKQTPWLVLPFVLTGIVLESRQEHGLVRGARDGARYLGIALAAFAVPNLPYLAWDPAAWARGVLTPLLAGTVPAGQGLISLSLSLGIGGGSLTAYTVASVVVMAAVLACFAAAYPVLKPAAFLIPSVVLFFASRSFGSYLVMLIPAAIAAAATVRRPAVPCWRHGKWVAAASAIACGVAVTVALTSASPLSMSILSVRTTGQLATVERVRLAVTNTSGGSVRPAFTIADGITATAFWRRVAGPPVLAPHQRARYTIEAPSYFAMPSIGSGFQVMAFAQAPASVSRTSAYVASQWRLVLSPATVSGPVTTGRAITVRAAIVDRFNRPMHVAGVPVYLGQVIYAQSGTEHSQAVIDRRLPGATPVRAVTGRQGVATFTVQSPVGGARPVYFEANLVKPQSGYPYGYSPILTVRFRR
ncbi:MAG TPA: hypothetical protein VFV41_10925 [Streptosporangiaceae bacterium]|nr:hypothetical protein [Streptosporangiaceae bacterium]